MGLSFSKVWERMIGKQDMRILMVGLDAAGKTTVLYKLKLGEVVTTIPTIGFNVETIRSGDLALTMWDVGGRDKIRPLWKHYLSERTGGVIFVVDSTDRDRLDEACQVLAKVLANDDLTGRVLLVFANKQDLPGAMTCEEVAAGLQLHALEGRSWHVQPSSATDQEGIHDGFEWLFEELESGTSSPASVVTLCAIAGGTDVKVSCTSMAGTELVRLEIQPEDRRTLACVRSLLADLLAVKPRRVRLVLPDGKLLRAKDLTLPVVDALSPRSPDR